MSNRVLLKLKRFEQYKNECAVASASSLACYYDSSLDYEYARTLLPYKTRLKGLGLTQQARLLNKLGFNSVTVMSADKTLFDLKWRKLPKDELIQKLKTRKNQLQKKRGYKDQVKLANDLISWYEDPNYDNNIIIDWNFPKYIKNNIDKDRPVLAGVNWKSIRKTLDPTASVYGDDNDTFQGDHSVIVRGYDDDGVFIVDSGERYGKLKGRYKLSWSLFLVSAVPGGDLIWVE